MIIGTDVLGRGIDVPAVTHVINYDAPSDIEDRARRIQPSPPPPPSPSPSPSPLP